MGKTFRISCAFQIKIIEQMLHFEECVWYHKSKR